MEVQPLPIEQVRAFFLRVFRMELTLPELAEIKCELADIKKDILQLKQGDKALLTQKWYTLEACCALKGGGKLNTYKSVRFYQPKGGIPDGYVTGRKVWERSTVAEWLGITDEELPQYHEKYHTGATR